MDIVSIISRAGIGALAGISYGFTGYAKSKGEGMDWQKFIKTGVLGACVGVISEFIPITMAEAEIYMTTFGLTAGIENLIKAAWRRIFRKE